jgi:hypothetical protein
LFERQVGETSAGFQQVGDEAHVDQQKAKGHGGKDAPEQGPQGFAPKEIARRKNPLERFEMRGCHESRR